MNTTDVMRTLRMATLAAVLPLGCEHESSVSVRPAPPPQPTPAQVREGPRIEFVPHARYEFAIADEDRGAKVDVVLTTHRAHDWRIAHVAAEWFYEDGAVVCEPLEPVRSERYADLQMSVYIAELDTHNGGPTSAKLVVVLESRGGLGPLPTVELHRTKREAFDMKVRVKGSR